VTIGQQALEFLKKYQPNQTWRLSYGKTPSIHIVYDDESSLLTDFTYHQQEGYSAWFRVACAITATGTSGSVRDEDIVSTQLLPIDIDLPASLKDASKEKRQEWQSSIVEKLKSSEFVPVPSVIISSGNGCQAFYLIEQPAYISGTFAHTDLSAIVHGLAKRCLTAGLPADPKVRNPSRLMRIPAGKNFKRKVDNEYPDCSILFESGRDYPIESFSGMRDYSFQSINTVPSVEPSTKKSLVGQYREIRASAGTLLRAYSGPQVGDKPDWQDESKLVAAIVKHLIDRGNSPKRIRDCLLRDASWTRANLVNKGDTEREIARKIDLCKKGNWLWKFNRKYSVVENWGGKPKIVWFEKLQGKRLLMKMNPADFFAGRRHLTKKVKTDDGSEHVPVAPWWFCHKLANRYKTVRFAPGIKLPQNILNLWQGFSVKPKQGDWSLFKDHMLHVICGGNNEYYEWLYKWMAFSVQYPGRPIGSAVVLLSQEGAGKGTFAEEFGALFGDSFRTIISDEHITGTFNSELENTCCLFLDEALFAGNRKHAEILKGLITEPYLTIHPKGGEKYNAKNNLHVIIATNNDHAVRASAMSRRFFVLNVAGSRIRDDRYFTAIRRQMGDGGRAAMLADLLACDLEGYNPQSVPQTDALAQQKEESLDTVPMILKDLLDDGRLVGATKIASGGAVDAPLDEVRVDLNSFLSWVAVQMKTVNARPTNRYKLGKLVARYLGVSSRVSHSKRYYIFPKLSLCRETFNGAVGIPYKWEPVVPEENLVGGRFDETGWDVEHSREWETNQ
jgi:hypothetical protein